jgi:peptide/nickel transport system ATP-binding protein
MLLASAPSMTEFGREIDPPDGEIPDPINVPQGCAFHPRCPIAIDRCKAERPKLEQNGQSRAACILAE